MPRTASERVYASLNALGVRLPLPDGRELFHDLTIGFGDERTGLVGANGSGKSTLARIVAGVAGEAGALGAIELTNGSVVRHGRIGYLAQNAAVGDAKTVAGALGVDATLDALRRLESGAGSADDVDLIDGNWDVRQRATRALSRMGLGALSLERSLGDVSGGEGTRLAMAALLVRDPDFLVLDEPTNHLDAEAREAVYTLVATWERGMLVVSHDRELLERVDRILELSSLGVLEYGGGYSAYRAQHEVEEQAAARAADAATRSVRQAARRVQLARERKEKSDARGRRARATGSQPKLVLNGKRERSQASSQRLSMQGERILDNERERLRAARARVAIRETLDFTLPSSRVHEHKRIIDADRLSFWHTSPNDALIDRLSLTVVGPEHLALVGPNGSGKTTLLHLLAGKRSPNDGTLRLGVPPERVALLEQRTSWSLPNGTLLENFLNRNPERDAGYARQALATFLFTGDAPHKAVAALSGGEALRASLALILHNAEPPALLLLDEPTNHLDLDGTLAIERALAAYDGALIVVSHDERFLSAIGIERRLTAPFGDSTERVEVAQQPPEE